jgi:hypothetical protein
MEGVQELRQGVQENFEKFGTNKKLYCNVSILLQL